MEASESSPSLSRPSCPCTSSCSAATSCDRRCRRLLLFEAALRRPDTSPDSSRSRLLSRLLSLGLSRPRPLSFVGTGSTLALMSLAERLSCCSEADEGPTSSRTGSRPASESVSFRDSEYRLTLRCTSFEATTEGLSCTEELAMLSSCELESAATGVGLGCLARAPGRLYLFLRRSKAVSTLVISLSTGEKDDLNSTRESKSPLASSNLRLCVNTGRSRTINGTASRAIRYSSVCRQAVVSLR
mmetsp:Transcript_2963/g.4116  ORF Transcript_2963/g.4116 Transcript_2963/m.4116 type:complete len:243 (-) Transcript_2963:3928-4656(-)